jgi:hypothetical protein
MLPATVFFFEETITKRRGDHPERACHVIAAADGIGSLWQGGELRRIEVGKAFEPRLVYVSVVDAGLEVAASTISGTCHGCGRVFRIVYFEIEACAPIKRKDRG